MGAVSDTNHHARLLAMRQSALTAVTAAVRFSRMVSRQSSTKNPSFELMLVVMARLSFITGENVPATLAIRPYQS